MPKVSDDKNANAPVVKEGWLSLQGSQGMARPVRGVLTDCTLSLYSAPERTRFATDTASKLGSTASLVAESSYLSNGSTSSLGVLGVSVAYKSTETPHPGFPNALNAEAVAHNLLFSLDPERSYAAVVLSSPVVEVANMLSAYIDLFTARSLTGAQSRSTAELTPSIAQRVVDYCEALLSFPAIVLNSTAMASVLHLDSSLKTLDAQLAEVLKKSISNAQEAAQNKLRLAFTPQTGSEQSPPVSKSRWAPKLLKLAETGQKLPTGAIIEPGFVDEFALQIAAFHRRLWKHWPPTSDVSLLFHTPHSSSAWEMNPLVFDSDSGHFLGGLVSNHLFSPGISDGLRATLIEKWIYLATRLRELGDSVGWVAILIVLFSPAVLRLTSTWSKVDRTIIARLAHGWGYEAFEVAKRSKTPFLEKKTFRTDTEDIGKRVAKGDCVPYFGDAIIQESHPHDPVTASEQLRRLEAVLSGWNAYFSSIKDDAPESQIPEDPAHQVLLAVWSKQHPDDSRLDKASLSLKAQPKLLGYYLSNFYQQPLPLTSGTMMPVLFTTAVPSFRLFPRPTLLLASQVKPSQRPRTALRRSSSFPPAGPPLTTGVSELDSGAREQLENTASAHALGKVVRDLLNVGTETIEVDSGLVFKTFISDEFSNIRSSRTSSIIETLNKRSSSAGKQVVVKSASMVRLVDVLVLGASVFGFDLKLDADAHISTLLATYRSFCSPAEMIDMLQVRVRCARGAARVLSEQTQRANNTTPFRQQIWQVSEDDDRTDTTAVHILTMIMTMLQKWVEVCFFDFMDDEFVLEAGNALLTALKQEISVGNYPDPVTLQCRRVTGAFLRHQYSIGRSDSHTPSWLPLVFDEAKHKRYDKIQSVPSELPVTSLEHDGGLAQINTMVDELDVIVADAFSRITMIHWMKLFEALEQQTANRLGLFRYATSPNVTETDVVVQNVFSWLCTLQQPNSKSLVLETLPEPIVALIRLHCGLVTYFAAQIADPSLAHAHERHDRMTFMLKMLGVLRARMQFFNLASDFDDQQGQHIPSFLEQAVVAAILLPESRAYANSWQAAGHEVARMFPRSQVATSNLHSHDAEPNSRNIFVPAIQIKQGRPMTVCIGWVIERLLEIACCVPNTSVDHPDLINFDKRRYAYNLIKNMDTEFSTPEPTPVSRDILGRYFFLFGESAKNACVTPPIIDRRLHRASLAREGKAKARVFVDIIAQELEKVKLEHRLYDKLERSNPETATIAKSSSFYGLPVSQSSTSLYSKRLSRLIPSTSTVDVASVLDSGSIREHPGSVGSNASGQGMASSISSPSTPSKRMPLGGHHQKRSRFGGFLKAVRPLSVLGVSGANPVAQSAGSSNTVSPPTSTQLPNSGSLYNHQVGSGLSLNSTPEEQQQPQSHDVQWVPDETIDLLSKSSLSEVESDAWQLVSHISLGSLCNVELRAPATLIVTHRSGPKPEFVAFRAPSAKEAVDWYEKAFSEMQDTLLQSTRVFGVPLQIVCARENRLVPAFLEVLLSQIEERGLDDVGVYRISGSLAAVNAMKNWFDQGNTSFKHDDPKWADINAVAGCIKLYLRELPQPLMTEELLPELLGAIGPAGVDTEVLRSAIVKLPSPNYHVLKRLTSHLRLIVEHSQQNKMNIQNIAIVFSVNFLPPVAINQMGGMQQIVSTLVLGMDQIFLQT